MKSILLKLALVLGLVGIFGAAWASVTPPLVPAEPEAERVCSDQGAPCGGDADCCSGFSCKQKMETGKRSCQPE